MRTLQEIEQRLAAIRAEVRSRGDALTSEELDALEREVTDLQEERTALMTNAETRTRLLDSIAAGNVSEENTAPTVLRSFPSATPSATTEPDQYGTQEYRQAFMNYVTRNQPIPVQYRADQVSTTSDVGAVIPTTILNRVIEKLESVGNILAKVTLTAYKGGVAIPVSTIKPVATWVSEGSGNDTQKHSLGSIVFGYHKLRCPVAVSLEVETMSLSAFENLITKNITEAMVKGIEQAIVSGSGTNQPTGIIVSDVDDKKIVAVVEPAYQDLIDAEAALPQAYEGGAEWCMTKSTFMQYYGLTDKNGQPIARINYGITGKPERFLLGRAVNCCDYLVSYASTLTAGSVLGFIFDFADYALNTNYAMTLKKYEDDETDDLVTKGIMIVDGKPVDLESLVLLKKADAPEVEDDDDDDVVSA